MNLSLFILSTILMSCNVIWIVFFTEMIQDQHWAQKIFYIHVPLAWVGFLSYFFVMVAGISYLLSYNLNTFQKDLKYDRIGHAAAEIGTLFTGLVLITGPIWATPIWGQPWVWEPRLITTLVLFLIYVGYFILRNIGIYRQRLALICAIVGIIAFFNIPIIFASVDFWAAEIQSHPKRVMSQQPSHVLAPFFFSLFAFTVLMVTMLYLRIKVLYLEDKEKNYV
tara:strand:- start:128 stop:796 length:669 start_codon:yes stop_codon:yes gene_type:complete